MLNSLDVSGSALTTERFRMDVIAGNIANAESTRTSEGGPYQRRTVSVSSGGGPGFFSLMERHLAGVPPRMGSGTASTTPGVSATGVGFDPTPPELRYDPTHPDAGEDGYVAYPNVDIVREMTDLMAVNRSYGINSSVFDVNKNAIMTTIRLGR